MAVLNPLFWHMSVDELNELSLVEWKRILSETEEKMEDKLRVFANMVIDTVLNNKTSNRLKTNLE